MTLADGKRQRLQLHVVRVVDTVWTTVTISSVPRTIIDCVLSIVQKKSNLFGDVIPMTLVPSLRVLRRDRVNGLPEQVIHRTLFRVENLVHTVPVYTEPYLEVGKG